MFVKYNILSILLDLMSRLLRIQDNMFRCTINRMASAPSEMIGASGYRYKFKELLQERPKLGRVWLATSGTPLRERFEERGIRR